MFLFIDNSVTFESGFGRFVPVRPQPRALPLTVQNRETISTDHNDDGAGSSLSSHTIHHFQNGMFFQNIYLSIEVCDNLIFNTK